LFFALLKEMTVLIALCLSSAGLASGLALTQPALRNGVSARAATPAMQFGGQKKKQLTLAEMGYWEGEWVCADCGYIYEPDASAPFEELKARWKCPQCAGPRRRFVKKAGNMLGNLDDSPLLYGSLFFALLTAGLVYIGLTI